MTSGANTIRRSPRRPWVNLFDGEKLSPAWKELIVRHPHRFVLAFDNVWEWNWRDMYLRQIVLWWKALNDLPASAAHALAHKNAERLWRLPAAKPVRIK